MEHLLTLQNLHVSYHTPRGTVQAVRGVDLTLDSGEVLAVVGEIRLRQERASQGHYAPAARKRERDRKNSCKQHGHRAVF